MPTLLVSILGLAVLYLSFIAGEKKRPSSEDLEKQAATDRYVANILQARIDLRHRDN